MDIDELERILTLMREFELAEMEIEDPERGTRIRLKKSGPAPMGMAVPSHGMTLPVMAERPATGAVPAAVEVAAESPDNGNLVEVPSPMVGTFYRASSPDSEAFVEVGDEIDEETVVCIVEAMKVMNEIKAEVAGEVVEILVANGEAVEYGQPLLLVRTE